MTEDYPESIYAKPEAPQRTYLRHYYGDIVRRLFLAGGVVLLVLIPWQKDIFPVGSFGLIFLVIIFAIIAGLTNSRKRWIATLNVVTAALALLIFGYFAIDAYTREEDKFSIFFIARQILALLFFFALYYSAKTLRGSLVRDPQG